MREEHNSVLSTPAEVDKIGYYGRYQYIGKTQLSADTSARPIYRSISSDNVVADAHNRVEIEAIYEHAAQLDLIDLEKSSTKRLCLETLLGGNQLCQRHYSGVAGCQTAL